MLFSKNLRRKAASILLITTVMFSNIAGGAIIASADTSSDSIISKFKNPSVETKPMARMWFPDASAGGDDNDLIDEQIQAMAEGGFGGVEIAMLADETTYTNDDSETIGWGTENWKNVLKKTLRAANEIEDGFKVDITITSHWPPNINTIDPNDDEASTQIVTGYEKITHTGTVDLPLPDLKYQDNSNGYFIFEDNYVDSVIAQVYDINSSGNIVLDYNSVINVSEFTDKKTATEEEAVAGTVAGAVYKEENGVYYEGHPAGIPDEAEAVELSETLGSIITAESILDNVEEAFGPLPDDSIVGKIDENGLRKRMADWQYYYKTNLSEITELGGYTPSEGDDISTGDWVLVGLYYRGTGQVMSGGSVNTMYNRPYATNYFSDIGIQEVIDYWNENLLNDEELVQLLEENGSSIFEDSIEASHDDGQFWTYDLMDEMGHDYDYKDTFALSVALSQYRYVWPDGEHFKYFNNLRFDNDTADRVVQDYNLKLGELYKTEHAVLVSDWAKTFNYDYRAQGYVLPGLDVAGAASALDIPEGDNETEGDGLRNISSAVNMYDKKFLSLEALTFYKIATSWAEIAKAFNGFAASGVNRVILHGSAYSKTFDYNHVTWPGWGWGGDGPGQFAEWNQRQIWWEDANIISDYMARNQAVMQNGNAKVDVALLNSTKSSFDLLKGNTMQELLDKGYSYNILSEAILESENAQVQNGVLYEDGPSYKAIILNEASCLSVDTLGKLIEYTESGLPIIIFGGDPEQVYGTESTENNDTLLSEFVEELKDKTNVKEASTKDEVLDALEELQISPAASYSQEDLETSHRVDVDGTDYYHLYNNSSDEITTTITFEGKGIPYILDAWTSEIVPVAQYTLQNGTVTMDINLSGKEAKIVAITENTIEFPETVGKHVVSTTGGEVLYKDGKMVFRSNDPNTYGVVFSDDTAVSVKVNNSLGEIDLTEGGWNLQLDSYGPDDSESNLDEDDNPINPMKHKITTLYYEDISLMPWTALPVTEEDMDALSTKFNTITSMEDVSGIGYYTKTFTVSSNWTSDIGAYMKFVHDEDMVTSVKINGEMVTDRIDAVNDIIDLGKYFVPGEECTLEIKLDSSIRNRISLEDSYQPSQWDTENSYNDYGLSSVVLVPYTEATLAGEAVSSDEFTVTTTFNIGTEENASLLEADKMLDAVATVTNNQSSSQQVILITALYDSNGSMVNVSYVSKIITGNATENFHAGFKLTSDITGYSAKAFVWDGVNILTSNMTPLSNVVEITD